MKNENDATRRKKKIYKNKYQKQLILKKICTYVYVWLTNKIFKNEADTQKI